MMRLIVALILSGCVHGFLCLAMPPLLTQQTNDVSPKKPSIRVTMSYKSPEPLFKAPPVPERKKNVEQKKNKVVTPPVLKRRPRKTEKKIVKPLPKKRVKKPEPMDNTPSDVKPMDDPPQKTMAESVEKTSKKTSLTSETDTKVTPEQVIKTLDVTSPEYKHNPSPTYPRRARKRGYEGLVELRVLISKDGHASDIKIHTSTGHSILDKQAIKTIKKWTFVPREFNGHPIETWVMVPVRFKLY